MARLFVAVRVPERILEALGDLRFEAKGVRWVPSAQIHLTLRFIGEVRPEALEGVRIALRAVEARPFTIGLKGVGHFPKDRAHVLWAGVHPADPVSGLAASVDVALAAAGLSPEGERGRRRANDANARNARARGGGAGDARAPGDEGARTFSPHVTIARLRSASPALVKRFLREHTSFECAPFSVEEFVLFMSTLSASGARHDVVEVYSLRPPGEAEM